MSRVASNYSAPRYNNNTGQSKPPSNKNSIGNGSGHGITVRSAAPPPIQKETVHACPICNGEYKDPRVLPCTHTYCLNCIRDKLMNNNRVTCPKCQQQVDEIDLNDLPRNLILSQEWRMNVQPVTSIPTPKKPVTYQSIISTPTQMSNQQDKRKPSIAESNGHDSLTGGTKSYGITSLVNAFSKSSGASGKTSTRSSRSSSRSNIQPVVSNLVKIYSEATSTQPLEKPRSESVASTGKNDELIKIFEQATHRSSQQQQQQRTSSASISKRPSQAREEAYEDMTWDTLVHGTVPVAPPFPDQWQKATENLHYPPQAIERPISAATTSDRSSTVDNLRDIIASINQHSHDGTPPSFPQGQILSPQSHSRPSTASRSQNDFDDDDDDGDNQIPIQPPVYASIQPSVYASIQPRPPSRHSSRADSVLSNATSSTIRQSPAPPIINTYQQRLSVASTPQQKQQQQQQADKMSDRSSSITSPLGRSPERFPLQTIQTFDFAGDEALKPRSPSVTSIRSLASEDINEQIPINQAKLLSTERFQSAVNIPPVVQTNNSSRARSQISSGLSTPTNRPASRSMERDTHYLVPTLPSSSSTTIAVSSRVDLLLSDQKRLEREIDEQIKRLKYDYDDIRKQVHRKESSIHNEVKNIAANLDDNITEHYHQQQKIYADLATDTNTIGNELERLKSFTYTNNNKQQLWDNLEKIEFNIRTIRRTVEQQKQSRDALTFSEGHRAIAADTIGQVTYNQIESHRRFNSPPLLPPLLPPPLPPAPASFQIEQTSTNIVPYKYIKIDHLSALEPEAIAMTENNKKILLGICNKLFILNEYGDTLKTILLAPSIRGITISKKYQSQNIAYVSHDESISMIDIDSGQTLDCVKETDSTGQSGIFLPLGIDTDNIRGDVYVCDYRNSCVLKFDDKLEFIKQWKIYNHSDQYDEARPKLISVYGQKLYMIVEHSCKPFYNQGIAYTFSLHICDANSGNIIKIIDADLLATQRLRWPCSVQAISNEKCYILDTMTSGKYFNGQWQKHWSRVLEIEQDGHNVVTELFQLDSEAATMAMTKQIMIIAANGDILFVDLGFLSKKQSQQISYDRNYQNLP
ncbi:unnamed protein product [Rotaria sp. Silwood2]|nr:unnamed protein product [Rotaria sp. Silwood2]CAF2722208.1 unnamed protein product [Rotaria sp. Silwood2]CAF2985736.1 unnamed protein product [Rotaria sp. Silwood2]CAF3141986.1 unnamed protein product [Rotaria sp. Silwood2]CAF3911386.1 unnamed protein product [Rotaria sp. Silwood2]